MKKGINNDCISLDETVNIVNNENELLSKRRENIVNN